jgi:hypothetical protein
MKKRKKEDIVRRPINLTWRDYLAGWNFPYSVPCRDKFMDLAAGKKVSDAVGTSLPGSPEDEFGVRVIEIALSA